MYRIPSFFSLLPVIKLADQTSQKACSVLFNTIRQVYYVDFYFGILITIPCDNPHSLFMHIL